MEINNNQIKIVEIDDTNVVLDIKGHVTTYSREAFNEIYDIDGDTAIINKNYADKFKKVNELVSEAAIATLRLKVLDEKLDKTTEEFEEYVEKTLTIGCSTREISELLNCSMIDAINLVKNTISVINPLFYSDKQNQSVNKPRKKRKQQKEKKKTPYTATQKLGDNPAFDELRKKFNK